MYVCVRLCVMILNTLTEAIKLEDIVRLLLVWLLLYCESSYETVYNEDTMQQVIVKLLYSRVEIDNDLVQTNLRTAW